MIDYEKVLIIIPCYKATGMINAVIHDLIDCKFKHIIVVDDCCPENSSKNITSKIVSIIKNKNNLGVGGAYMEGFKHVNNNKKFESLDFIAKIDADGQHNAHDLRLMLNDIIEYDLDMVKGNRYLLQRSPKNQSFIRKIGNSFLTLLTKIASGNWLLGDPVNGQFIIRKNVFRLLFDGGSLKNRFLFETSLLLGCCQVRAKVRDCPNSITYGDEISSLSIFKSFFQFSIYLLSSTINRIINQYFYPSINFGSILIIFAIIFLSAGTVSGFNALSKSFSTGIGTEFGLISIILLMILIGVISLFGFFIIDQSDSNRERPPIHRYLK